MTTEIRSQGSVGAEAGRLDAAGLARIAAQPGPCLTLLVPAHHPGSSSGSQRATLRALLKDARQNGDPLFDQADDFVSSLPDAGGPGFAVFFTPASRTCVRWSGGTARAIFAGHPFITPILEDALAAHQLLVLSLNTKHLKLYEATDGHAQQLPLPAGVPHSVEEWHHAHTSTTHGEARTAAGHSSGQQSSLRFGTSQTRESARSEVEHFCAVVDAGLQHLVGNRPLVLMGVREEIAAYRRVSQCASLLSSELDGNREALSPTQIADQLEACFLGEGCDGFNLLPPHVPGSIEAFVTLVVPELQKRGLYRTEYEGRTLRDNLDLPRPARRE